MYKILALDGGGIRSIYQARILERLELKLGKSLRPDLYAGTSAGSILACGIQFLPPAQLVSFFAEHGPNIFKRENFLENLDDLFNLKGAKYETKDLKRNLTKVFADKRMRDLPHSTLITSFDLRSQDKFWRPVVFHNMRGLKASPELPVVDAILRSTAAPTYFPVYQNHCDGAVWGNNPSMSAVAAALDVFVGGQDFAEIVVLSIGTGRRPAEIAGGKRDLGVYDWYKNRIFEVLMDGNTEAPHYYVRSLLNTRYFRLQIDLDQDIKLDDADRIPDMLAYAERTDLEALASWLQGFWI